MENRRDFIKKAGLLAGSFGLFNSLPQSIQAALQINPTEGSTYMDAEHIVLLMQENRSFDHSFGTLKGVRGFNDSRAVVLPDRRPVWLQSYRNGNTYMPFRLDIQNSNAAWTSYLPHSWENQIGAWNKGAFNNWLEWKRSDYKKYRDLPLTLGYYTREDIPFYYAFADAFTICDQNFCSSITGTTTNRHFFWTGTCVPEKGAKPLIRNSDIYYNRMARWKTFPERLEEANISWKVYQNELSIQTELSGTKGESWLANFTDNNLEWFEQYHVRYKKSHIDFYRKRLDELPVEIETMERALRTKHDQKLRQKLQQKREQLQRFQEEYNQYNDTRFAALDARSRSLHERAFQTNEGDPYYHEIEEVDFEGTKITVPKGDVLHQFREDVKNGELPTVSWLCAPQNFSDHPSAPMYGAWYVSEILNILTENPDVWKKTIFILNYDENDGYFDHIPPFVAPKPGDKSTGATSVDLDTQTEYVTKEQELAYGIEEQYATEGPVGLGYRVPLIVASPWSKGGWVNSEVFDITSTLQFMEHFLSQKFGVEVMEENISSWRRAITGNLTSVFRPFKAAKDKLPDFIKRDAQVAWIDQAKDKPIPDGAHKLQPTDISAVIQGKKIAQSPLQEKGTKPANAICYELYVHEFGTDSGLNLQFEASNQLFGTSALGSGFNVYAYGYLAPRANWSFACSAGSSVSHQWKANDFENNQYHLAVYGPNGFHRVYQGTSEKSSLHIVQRYLPKTEELAFEIENLKKKDCTIVLYDHYSQRKRTITLASLAQKVIKVSTKRQQRWYDIEITLSEDPRFLRKYAGHMENGKDGTTDPLMG